MTATASLVDQIKTVRTVLSAGRPVYLSFRKNDGTTRDAVITRNLKIIPVESHPKFVRGDNPDYICGFDIDKKKWIRFHKDRLIAVYLQD